eukprot:3768500-Amphidinium_carterae.1
MEKTQIERSTYLPPPAPICAFTSTMQEACIYLPWLNSSAMTYAWKHMELKRASNALQLVLQEGSDSKRGA